MMFETFYENNQISRKMKIFLESVPVWPLESSLAVIHKKSRIPYNAFQLPANAPLCESDEGKISFPSQEVKTKYLSSVHIV